MSLSAVFFGTPDFAVPSLAHLIETGTDVALVVTQPDRPSGRHAAPRPSAIAIAAAERGLTTVKPERVSRNAALLDRLKRVAPDVGVVVAYGRILPTEILAAPRLGFVNVHASLLPKYRGASPVQAALLAGERQTGVVTMRVEKELDAGPLYLERRTEIEEREDAASLSRRLATIGASLLAETLQGLERGTLAPRPQEGTPSFCRPIRREDGEIDWGVPAADIERRLRAFTPWPGIYSFVDGERFKVLEIEIGPSTKREPGSLWREGSRVVVAAGGGTSVVLKRVQRAGRQVVDAGEFVRGLRGLTARLGRT
jgi:methionyl-tRNA formyltransferase